MSNSYHDRSSWRLVLKSKVPSRLSFRASRRLLASVSWPTCRPTSASPLMMQINPHSGADYFQMDSNPKGLQGRAHQL